mmetsp:Transcript_79793/g.145638  ORF Transcript_79793/g.145638 Transcript_79793/m.145638 type:complete len:479 (-) Transcript_79793:121-1557(-)
MRQPCWWLVALSLLTCSLRLSGFQIDENGNPTSTDGACDRIGSPDATERGPEALRSCSKATENHADIETLIQLQTNMGASSKGPNLTANATNRDSGLSSNDILEKATEQIDKVALNASASHKLKGPRWHHQMWKIWERLERTRRHRRRDMETLGGVRSFFRSALVYEWFIFIVAIALFVPLQYFLLRKKVSHVASLLLWVSLGIVYNILIGVRLGTDAAVMWFTGYLLELVFSIENVFVFHVVVRAFSTPEPLTHHALFTVIMWQIAFEMVFFMGLAKPLRTWGLLPYLLGVWLIAIGIMAAREEESEDIKVEDTWAYSICKRLFGTRLLDHYELNDTASVHPSYLVRKDGKMYVSMLLPATCCLLLVDFLLEVDVTITKIEELQNQYLAFTSSAAAAFALVSLFFVAGDLFHRFKLLQYGISFVLIFFGAQMLLHKVVSISPLASCTVIILVMILCIVLSNLMSEWQQSEKASEDAS